MYNQQGKHQVIKYILCILVLSTIVQNNKIYAQEFPVSKTCATMIPAVGVTFASLWASDYLYAVRKKHNFKERTSALWYALPHVGLASFAALAGTWYNGWSNPLSCAGVVGILITPGVVKAVMNRRCEKKADERQAEREREMQRLREIEQNKQKARDAMPFLLTTNIHQKDPSDIANALHNLQYADQDALYSFADKLTVTKINDLLQYVNEPSFKAPGFRATSDFIDIYNELPRLLGILQKRFALHDLSKVDVQKMLRCDFNVDKSKISEISEVKFRTILPALYRFVPDPFDSYSNRPFPERLDLLIEMYPRAIENIINLLQARADREHIVNIKIQSLNTALWRSVRVHGQIPLGGAHKLQRLLQQGLQEYQARRIRDIQEIKETEPILFYKFFTIIEQ